jgi:hypothetical protein
MLKINYRTSQRRKNQVGWIQESVGRSYAAGSDLKLETRYGQSSALSFNIRTPLNVLGTFSISSALVFMTDSPGKTVVSNEGCGQFELSAGESRRENGESMASNDPT